MVSWSQCKHFQRSSGKNILWEKKGETSDFPKVTVSVDSKLSCDNKASVPGIPVVRRHAFLSPECSGKRLLIVKVMSQHGEQELFIC